MTDLVDYKNMKCEDIIKFIISKGGIITSEKNEGSNKFNGKIIILKKNRCQFKISYLNLNNTQLAVCKTCCCKENWRSISFECFKNF